MSPSPRRVLLVGLEQQTILQLQKLFGDTLFDRNPVTCHFCDAIDISPGSGEWDIVFVGESGSGGLKSIAMVESMCATSDLPIVLRGDSYDRDLDLAAIAAGADDYVTLAELTPRSLDRTLDHAIERCSNRTLLRQGEARLDWTRFSPIYSCWPRSIPMREPRISGSSDSTS